MTDNGKGVEPMDVDSSCSYNEIMVGEGNETETANQHSSQDIKSSSTMTNNNSMTNDKSKRNRLNIAVYIPKERAKIHDEIVPTQFVPNSDETEQTTTGRIDFEPHWQRPSQKAHSQESKSTIAIPNTSKSPEDPCKTSLPNLNSSATNAVGNEKNDLGVSKYQRTDEQGTSVRETGQTSTGGIVFEPHWQRPIPKVHSQGSKSTIPIPSTSKSPEEPCKISPPNLNSGATNAVGNEKNDLRVSEYQRTDEQGTSMRETGQTSHWQRPIPKAHSQESKSTIAIPNTSKSHEDPCKTSLPNLSSGASSAVVNENNEQGTSVRKGIGKRVKRKGKRRVEEKVVEFVPNVGSTVPQSKCPQTSSSQEQILHDAKSPSHNIEPGDSDEVFYELGEEVDETTRECDIFSDVEDIICGQKAFKHHKWTPSSSAHRLYVGNSGSWYEGGADGNKMSGLGTLHSSDNRQFIKGVWFDNILYDLHSCQFTDQGSDEWTIYLRKQSNSYLLTFDEDEFVARAQLSSNYAPDFSLPFGGIKLCFFRNLTIPKVIEDRLQSTRESALNRFENALKTVLNDASNPAHFAAVLISLRKYSRDHSTKVILTNIIKNENTPRVLFNAANSLLKSEKELSSRRLGLLKFSRDTLPPESEVQSVIQIVYTDAINNHRQSLVDKCPSCLPSLITNIRELPTYKIIYVSKADIELFHHLATMTKEHHVLSFINELHLKLFNKLRSIDSSSPPNVVMPLSTPVYGFIFKSFLEIISEISLKAENCSESTMLAHEHGKLKLVDEIRWTQDTKQSNRTSLTQHSLECQYHFIFKLLRHFEPKHYLLDKNFHYEFEVLNKEDSNDSWLKKQFKSLTKRNRGEKNLSDIPQDRKVWLYILDHTIYKVIMKNSSNSPSCIELFRPALDGHVLFVSRYPTDSHESFRVATHNILMFIMQAIPHVQGTDQLSDEDIIILEKQMKYIIELSVDMRSDALVSSDFRNLIDEYNRYWSLRHLVAIDESLYPDYLVSQIQDTNVSLLALVDASLDKTVQVSSLVSYLRELNDFIEDFKDIDFPSNWYIKSDSISTGVIEKVSNKIASETRCSYKVIDLKRFIDEYDDGCVPQHHIIHVVRRLLKCAISSLTLNWISTSEQSVAQLEATGALLGAIRSSFLYLKEQPDYRDFELFTNESVQPFLQVVSKCRVLEKFKIRVNIVKESFWYIRKMDEIGIVQALELFNKINHGSLKSEKLKQCYDRYLLEYNEYIGKAKPESVVGGVNSIVQCMKNHKADYKELAEWDEDFKTEELPKMLAGLGAVWSLLVSKDVSSSGKFLKPHCIQILCIMRLLSLDNSSQGVEHHLAQVLTGQGKSVILGLLSAILAFTGYKVRVLCYSEYLVTRDAKDFNEFFNALGVTQYISYGTFEDMANEFVNPVFQGETVSLRNLVKSIVLEHQSLKTLGSPSSDVRKTVLLVDEVDVFFSEHYYGNTYNSVAICEIPGLSQIQEKIWTTALGSDYEQKTLYSIIQEFIDAGVKSGNQELGKYNKFRLKPGKILLLDKDDEGNLIIDEFTNRSLLEKHLMDMVEDAIHASKGTMRHWYINSYKIIDGLICCLRLEDGVYSNKTVCGYYNTFNYFRLKEAEFDQKNSSNYGYILLQTGRISYAKLPEEFPLILGVSGTVSNLSDYENEALKSYNINSISILPSFFGDSNLKFNKVDNFCLLDSKQDWSSKIFERINTVLQGHRSVLVFFNSDMELESFQKDFGIKFDRLNVLTENTGDCLKSKYIDEAGISNTVTLGTRGMGRGVDFKSSMAVEKKGGVHVIQTFFSLDVKEETQIKGRTARKDNKGSYELILCKEHLVAVNLLRGTESDAHDYSSLHQTRLDLMKSEGEKKAENIKKSEASHKLTMEFYGFGAGRKK